MVNRVVVATKQYLTQWKAAQGRTFIAPLQPLIEGDGVVIWVKPKPNVVKVLVDAAIFADREEIGFGFVARNSAGELIEAKTVVHNRLTSPVTAEAMAMKEVLSWIAIEKNMDDSEVPQSKVRAKVPVDLNRASRSFMRSEGQQPTHIVRTTRYEHYGDYGIHKSQKRTKFEDFIVIKEFQDMFLDELSTFPLDIEIEFVTDLAPEMKPVSKAPHGMAPVKVKKLAK
ncbi:hypothetical protein AgCh_028866 [Apium graveolens]